MKNLDKKSKSHKYLHGLCIVAVLGLVVLFSLRQFGMISLNSSIYGSTLFFTLCMASHILMIPLILKLFQRKDKE